MKRTAIGESVRRHEDLRFLTGKGRYIDDIKLANQAHAVVLRSPHAHARINGIDAKAALAMPGVLLVVTADDWKREGYGPIPTKSAVNKKLDGSPLNEPPRHCLAIGKARHVGEAVALVVAETVNIALDALDLIEVDYEPLPAVTDAKAALKASDHVIEIEVVNNRVTAVPIEPRGAIALYDKATDAYTLYNATQNVHANRDTYAEKVLHVPKEKIRHVAPDVGGGFGVKNGVYPEPALLMYAAKKLGRPVKWINTRSESFVSDSHGRNQLSTVKLGVNKDGKFQALYTETIGDLGAYCWTVGPFTPTGGSARTQGGAYAFKAMYYCSKAAFTNTMAMDPYRGAGRPEASFQIERVVERFC